MAEFVKGRALSEDSAPLARRLRRFILVLSQVFSAGAVRMDGACFCSRTAQNRARPFQTEKHPKRAYSTSGVQRHSNSYFLAVFLPALCTVQTVYSGAAMQIDE